MQFYVVTSDRELHKCSVFGVDCHAIDTFNSEPLGVSFDANGDGYVITDETRTQRINRFVNDRLVGDRLLENSSFHDVIM